MSLERNDDVVNECNGGREPTAVQPTRLITKRSATDDSGDQKAAQRRPSWENGSPVNAVANLLVILRGCDANWRPDPISYPAARWSTH